MPNRAVVLLFALLASAPSIARAQILRDPGTVAAAPSDPSSPSGVISVKRAQELFERMHLDSLPSARTGRPAQCDEQVGNVCYWYDEKAPPSPVEPLSIKRHRDDLISLLDSAAIHAPADRWAAEQRVRYLTDAGRFDSAYAAAKECKVGGWWCDGLQGFSLHLLGRYAESEKAYNHALTQMLPRDRCEWQSIDLFIDDDTRQQYRRFPCDNPGRVEFENRVWYFARTLYSMDGNDSPLYIPTPQLESILDRGLRGFSLAGLPLRTRSKVAKSRVCEILGYPCQIHSKNATPTPGFQVRTSIPTCRRPTTSRSGTPSCSLVGVMS